MRKMSSFGGAFLFSAMLVITIAACTCSNAHESRAGVAVRTSQQSEETKTNDVNSPAGTVVSAPQTADLSQWFRVTEIPDTVFLRMQGKSWKQNCTLKREELRYLRVLHCNTKGETQVGELVCNRLIADRLLRVFKKLYEANYRIERITLVDDYDADDKRSMEANNTSCFNFRTVAGTQKLSNHSRGLAVDLNPLYNPYVFTRAGKQQVQPEKGKPYADRSARLATPVTLISHGDLAYQVFRAEGFVWGGDWRRSKDYQHFEFLGQRKPSSLLVWPSRDKNQRR